jgi:hypothetical protein
VKCIAGNVNQLFHRQHDEKIPSVAIAAAFALLLGRVIAAVQIGNMMFGPIDSGAAAYVLFDVALHNNSSALTSCLR